MNLLVDTLPEAVEVDGVMYEIDTDFRQCLRIIMAFEDPELTNFEKQMIMLTNLYGENAPENLHGALKAAIGFLDGAFVVDEDQARNGPKVYSFNKDAMLIYSAFSQTHGVDLSMVDMHWWKFLALFMDLGAETTFTELVGLRKRVKTGTATKEERKLARDLGSVFVVEDYHDYTTEELEMSREFMEALGEA